LSLPRYYLNDLCVNQQFVSWIEMDNFSKTLNGKKEQNIVSISFDQAWSDQQSGLILFNNKCTYFKNNVEQKVSLMKVYFLHRTPPNLKSTILLEHLLVCILRVWAGND
jgi:hypothetical protein